MAVDVEGQREGGLEAIGDAHGIAGITNPFEQDGEFIATETAEQEIGGHGDVSSAGNVVIVKGSVEAARDLDENTIGGSGTEVGIPVLEAIDINEESGVTQPAVATGLRKAALQALEKDAAIGEAGEAVVERVVSDLLFGDFAGGNVTVDDDQFFDLPLGIANGAGGGFEHALGAVFVAQAVLKGLADAGFAGLARGFKNAGAIVGMNLLES